MKNKNMFMIIIVMLFLFIVLGVLTIHQNFADTSINRTIGTSESKAYAPSAIPPVLYKDIRILTENSSQYNMGIVQAFNTKTNKLIWSKKIYEVNIDSNIEEDVQLVFIKDMKIENDKLVVINEKNVSYTLDPYTGEGLDSD